MLKSITYLFSIIIFITLSNSCTDYTSYIECKINGDTFREESVVEAQYISFGSATGCFLQANGNPWTIKIRTNLNVPGVYECTEGSNSPGYIEFSNGVQTFTTNDEDATGNIELIQVGSNLVEGYFSGTLVSGSTTLIVQNGEFSSRAF
jgi:hypothetical protein